MRRRHKILLGVAFIALLLFVWWIASIAGPRRQGLSFGLSTARGHFPEPGLIYADHIVVTWVTNTGRFAATLFAPSAQIERAGGTIVTDLGSSWNQQGYELHLPAGSAAWVAHAFNGARRLRACFDYQRGGGPLLAIASKAASILPLRRLPQQTYNWLYRKGIVDGSVHGRYEGPWMANPQGAATGRQPVESETNRTSAAAASRRSP